MFEDVSVQSCSYCLLYASYISSSGANNKGKKSTLSIEYFISVCHSLSCFVIPDDPELAAKLKSILQHLLNTLPVAGENYLIVFKLIHDLCLGEVCLSPSDLSLLDKHVEPDSSEKGERGTVQEGQGAAEEARKDSTEGDHAATPTNSATPTLPPVRYEEEVKSTKVDSKAEVSRLFKLLKTEGKPQDVQPKPFPMPTTPPKKAEKRWRKPLFAQPGPWLPTPPEAPSEDPLVTACQGVVEEMDVGTQLLQFCWNLPVFQKLSHSESVFAQQPAASKEGSEDAETAGITPQIKKFVIVWCCQLCVCVCVCWGGGDP